MKEHLFVIFPRGLGGNHCANLLSLTDRFSREVDYSLYDSSNNNAHYGPVMNLQPESVKDNIDSLVATSSVLCGHLAEFLWLKETGIVDRFSNRKFLIIALPEKGTIAYNRLVEYNPQLNDDYFYHEQRLLYSEQSLRKLFEEHDFFTISADVLFSDDAARLLSFIETEFYTKVDSQRATEIHSKWLGKIKR